MGGSFWNDQKLNIIKKALLPSVEGGAIHFYNKKVTSEIGFKGTSKKVMMFALVALGNIIDQYIIGSGSSIRIMIIMFYLSNEGISIIENAGKYGFAVASKA